MIAGNGVVADFLPFGAADEVLGHEEGVAEDVWVGGHGYEIPVACRVSLYVVVGGYGGVGVEEDALIWHLLPDLVQEGAVVDTEGGCDALLEALPVFGVVGDGPFVAGGHAALHLC